MANPAVIGSVGATTRSRYRVVALVTGPTMNTNPDRASIAALVPGTSRALRLTTVQMGYVFTVFHLAYALFEIECGRNHVSVVDAAMNSAGNLAPRLNPLIVAYSVQWFGS